MKFPLRKKEEVMKHMERMESLAAKLDFETLRTHLGLVKTAIQEDGKDKAKVTVTFNGEVLATLHFLFWKDGVSAWTAELLRYSFEDEVRSWAVEKAMEVYEALDWVSLPTEVEVSHEIMNIAIAEACKALWFQTPTIWVVGQDMRIISIGSVGLVDFVYLRGKGFRPTKAAEAVPGYARFPMVF